MITELADGIIALDPFAPTMTALSRNASIIVGTGVIAMFLGVDLVGTIVGVTEGELAKLALVADSEAIGETDAIGAEDDAIGSSMINAFSGIVIGTGLAKVNVTDLTGCDEAETIPVTFCTV